MAAGHTGAFKPAEQATLVAHQLVRVLHAPGLPPGVLNLVSGQGEVLGPRLATHPDIRFVSFVGSRAVGTALYHQASATVPGQQGLRRVMTEMGGKNATIVADDADFEWAMDEVATAAFGYQGQKCSATSRAIVMQAVYPQFVEGMAERGKKWASSAGLATDNAWFGRLIEQSALDRVLGYLDRAPSWGAVRTGGHRMDRAGYFVEPTIVDGVQPDTPIFQDEIFGPVLAITSVSSFEDALDAANNSEYALTGAVFTRSPERLAMARDQFYVGNLYLNRSSTGAMAGVHPFGGFKFSGTGPKVGSPDYLGFFLEAQVITEKVQY